MTGATEAALHARNLERLRALPELKAIEERAPDLVVWLFAQLDGDPVRAPRERRDDMLRDMAMDFGRSPHEQARRLAEHLQRYREGRLSDDEAMRPAVLFALGAGVPSSPRQLLRILTSEP